MQVCVVGSPPRVQQPAYEALEVPVLRLDDSVVTYLRLSGQILKICLPIACICWQSTDTGTIVTCVLMC